MPAVGPAKVGVHAGRQRCNPNRFCDVFDLRLRSLPAWTSVVGACLQAMAEVSRPKIACKQVPTQSTEKRYLTILSPYVRFNHDCGTGTMQMFIERLSADSIADSISMRVPSALKVGCG
jgi:hypothetical protein